MNCLRNFVKDNRRASDGVFVIVRDRFDRNRYRDDVLLPTNGLRCQRDNIARFLEFLDQKIDGSFLIAPDHFFAGDANPYDGRIAFFPDDILA